MPVILTEEEQFELAVKESLESMKETEKASSNVKKNQTIDSTDSISHFDAKNMKNQQNTSFNEEKDDSASDYSFCFDEDESEYYTNNKAKTKIPMLASHSQTSLKMKTDDTTIGLKRSRNDVSNEIKITLEKVATLSPASAQGKDIARVSLVLLDGKRLSRTFLSSEPVAILFVWASALVDLPQHPIANIFLEEVKNFVGEFPMKAETISSSFATRLSLLNFSDKDLFIWDILRAVAVPGRDRSLKNIASTSFEEAGLMSSMLYVKKL